MKARLALVVSALVLATACTSGGSGTGLIAAVGLQSFDDCDGFLSYVKGHALERVTPYGLPGGYYGGPIGLEGDVVALPSEAAADSAASTGGPVSGVDYSGTNIQVEGVDEPDIVKTDGRLLIALVEDRLFVVDVSGPAPSILGSLRLRDVWIRDLLLLGDRALLLGETTAGDGAVPLLPDSPVPVAREPIAALIEVDLSDPAQPRLARRLLLDGSYLSARMIDGIARIVVRALPAGLPFVYPEQGGLRAERDALRDNREVIRRSTIEQWVPYFVLEDADERPLAEGPLLDCSSAAHPPEFSGFGMLTVLTLDLSRRLDANVRESSVGILSDGETVYASATSLYVATERWMDWERIQRDGGEPDEGHVTRIHRFDITGAGPARHRASGEVEGWLLNQFSMDEHEGHLRVATTDAPPFWENADDSESGVSVLAERDGRLVRVGGVGGLGKGERIYSVRFLGDRGYVVTFRQVDPLYVIDLSDPAAPAVTGELKIKGYSAYLHPLDDTRLLGVGQDATAQGRTKGTQLSVFDVSDPTSPQRTGTVRVSDASSEAEWDHHAFLYWAPAGLVVVPVSVYRYDGEKEEYETGALAVRVDGGGLAEEGRLSHQDRTRQQWGAEIRRTLVVGDRLYTVSSLGIEVADLATLEDVGWVEF